MTPERFQQASAIFLEVRAMPEPRRRARLEAACGADHELRGMVETLLSNDARGSERDDTLGVDREVGRVAAAVFGHTAPGEPPSQVVGRRVGRYELIRKIGEGGMGVVYEARQENPSRVVALKLIRSIMMTPQARRRFSHEAQVLGRLQHPGIAQIHEASSGDDDEEGQPYFAMELVDGLPLTDHARRRDASIRERLDLLARVCDAVEHAHQKGVIHRDLKPANILVVESGGPRADHPMGKGADAAPAQPKILDFGIARAIDADTQAATLSTTSGQLIGTMTYMSPEQMSGDPLQIDTRSDVYALGVIGYELLAGEAPIDVRGKPVPEAIRALSEHQPPMLGRANRSLRGDVEVIIAKAMEPDKQRRYQSAAELAADIRRALTDRPILARPAGRVDRFRKFARRHRSLVAGTAAALVMLVAGVIGTTGGLMRSLEQQRKAARMNDYLRGMIGWFHPSESRGEEVTLRQVLDEAARRLDAELADEPEVAAALHDAIGAGYASIGEPRAQAHLDAALAARETLFGAQSRPVAETLAHLAMMRLQQGQHDEAQALADRVLSMRGDPLAEDDPLLVDALMVSADAHMARHDLGRAEAVLREAMQLAAHAPRPDDRKSALLMSNLAETLLAAKRYDEAEPLIVKSLALRRRTGGGDSLDCAGLLGHLAELTLHRGDSAASEAHFRESLGILRRVLGPTHQQVAPTLGTLALLVHTRGDFEQSVQLHGELMEMSRGRLPNTDPMLVGASARLGSALLRLERFAEAEPALRETIELKTALLGAQHWEIAELRSGLGLSLAGQGRFVEAEPLLLAAIEPLESALGAENRRTIAARERAAKLYEFWGKPERAAAFRVSDQTPHRSGALPGGPSVTPVQPSDEH